MNYDDNYDAKYCNNIADLVRQKIHKSFTMIEVSGLDKVKEIPKEASIVYASLHKSHMDYIVSAYTIHNEGLPYPRTIAGQNLFMGVVDLAIKTFSGIDLSKGGAISFKRTNNAGQNRKTILQTKQILEDGLSLLVYPEYDSLLKKTGRSYDGLAKDFSPLFFEGVKRASYSTPIFVVPMSVTYDYNPETLFYESLFNSKKLSLSKSLFSFIGGLKNKYNEIEFFRRGLFDCGDGRVYVNFDKPFRVDSKMNSRDLAKQTQNLAKNSFKITPISLLSRLLCDHPIFESRRAENFYDNDSFFSKSYTKQNFNFDHSDFLRAKTIMQRNNLIEISNNKDDTEIIKVKNPFAIEYYANTIKHFFKNVNC